MSSDVESQVLSEIDVLLTKLNKKLDKIIIVQAWLNNFMADVERTQNKVTPGVI